MTVPLRLAALAALGAAGLLGGAACEQLLGIEDRVLHREGDAGPDAAVDDAASDGSLGDAPVLPDASPKDAPDLPDGTTWPDSGQCPVSCTYCLPDRTCVINCGAGECSSGVVCPSVRPCQVNCIGDQACETGLVDCTRGSRCEINCIGTDACDEGVICAGISCTVVCDGTAACEDQGVDCNAEHCDIQCRGANACLDHVCCNGVDCGIDCFSSAGGCCSCSGC